MILCLNHTVDQSCQAPSSKYLKTNRIDVINTNDIDEYEETDAETTKIPNSTCIQSYSTYKIDGHEPFLIPSGCKCHNVKYLWQLWLCFMTKSIYLISQDKYWHFRGYELLHLANIIKQYCQWCQPKSNYTSSTSLRRKR